MAYPEKPQPCTPAGRTPETAPRNPQGSAMIYAEDSQPSQLDFEILSNPSPPLRNLFTYIQNAHSSCPPPVGANRPQCPLLQLYSGVRLCCRRGQEARCNWCRPDGNLHYTTQNATLLCGKLMRNRVWALLLLLLDTLVFQLLFLIALRLQLIRDSSLLACDTPLVPVSVPEDVPPSSV